MTEEPFRRANFFPGLQVGPAYWNSIEDYHFRKESLYNELFHGSGVVPGFMDSMHIHAGKTKGGLLTLLAERGLAFDVLGRPVFLYEPQAIVLDPKKFKLPCTVYVVVSYSEKMADYYENSDNPDMQGYRYKLETAKLDIVQEMKSADHYIELARVRLSDEDGKGISEIRQNDNFCEPETNMLDFRFVPWAVRVKQGMSEYLRRFLIDQFEYTRDVANSCCEMIQLVSFRNLQTVAMTGKMILQAAGVYYDDIISLISPLFDLDHQVLFEIAEYERADEKKERLYTVKVSYENARSAMYRFGDYLKSYDGSYEATDRLIKEHRAVMDGLRQTIVEKEVSSNDIKYISYTMPHVLLYGESRYTLVDTINMVSAESLENHRVSFEGSQHPSTSNEVFSYPDGVIVHDTVKRWIGGTMKFTAKNLVKGRKTILIRRTDIHQGNYPVEILLNGKKTKTMNIEGIDTKNRWRNLFTVFEEGEISDYAPEIGFNIGETGRDNSGTIWIYQLL